MRIGFYEKEITPPIGVHLPGQYELRISTGVLDRLYAKAVAFDNGKTQLVLIVVDATDLKDRHCAMIRDRFEKLTGLAPEQLMISATHTHQGLPTGDPVGSEEDASFMAEICRLIADCGVLALRKLTPCTLSYATGCVEGISWVRDYVTERGDIRTNPGRSAGKLLHSYSETDPEVPVLCAKDGDGNVLGMIYGVACHQDCVGGSEFTGDYSSEVSRRIKKAYGEDTVSIYIAAASGDINNIDYMHERHRPSYVEMGQKIAAELIRVLNEEATPVVGDTLFALMEPLSCTYRRATKEELEEAEECVRTGKKPTHAMMSGSTGAELILMYEREREADGKIQGELIDQIFRIGDITLFAVQCELYHQFAERMKQLCPERRCLISTLSNGDAAYVPVPENFGYSVYPTQLCQGSCWTPDTGDRIVEHMKKLFRSGRERT